MCVCSYACTSTISQKGCTVPVNASLRSTSCTYLAHHELESIVVIIIIIVTIIIIIVVVIVVIIIITIIFVILLLLHVTSCRTLLRTPSAAAAQGQLPGQVPGQAPGQAGAPAQQLPAQPATTKPTAACHQPLMRRTATSCCCWTLQRSCTRLPLMMALSLRLLPPMVCTVTMCSSFSNVSRSTFIKSNSSNSIVHLSRTRVAQADLSLTHTLPACCMVLFRSACMWQLDCSLLNMLGAVEVLCKAASHDNGN